QAHVAAAKAAVAPKAGNGQPWHVYQGLFNELCTENRAIDAMAANVAQGKWEGRGDWYYAPHKFFDNLYFIGTKTAGMYVINTTVTIYITPGDTPGTLSLIFPAIETTLQMTYEKPKRGPHNHMVALWGGTDFSVGRQGVTYWTDAQTLFKTYLASLARFKGLADAAG